VTEGGRLAWTWWSDGCGWVRATSSAGTPAPAPARRAIQVRVTLRTRCTTFAERRLLTEVRGPHGCVANPWVESGTEVSPFYDPLLAKIIVRG